MDVIEAIHGRRSIRAYQARLVDRALIEDVIWAAAQAPTPPVSGDQPWVFCVIEGVDVLASYGVRAKEYARVHQPEGAHREWAESPDFKIFWEAPALALVCCRIDNPEAALDCCRAGQNLMLAAHARGLGSCWVGSALPWLHSPGVAEELSIPTAFVPYVALILGYAAEAPAGNPRSRPFIHWCGKS